MSIDTKEQSRIIASAEQFKTLDTLIEHVYGLKQISLRGILVYVLSRSGPVWHRFTHPVRIKGIIREPGQRALLRAYKGAPIIFAEGYVPSFLNSTREESHRVILPRSIAERIQFILSHSSPETEIRVRTDKP